MALPPGVRLAKALESLGPSAIKAGQLLACRPDIIGDGVARGLESLQDRLPPFSETAARAIVEDELGRPLDTVFSDIRPAGGRGLDRAGAQGRHRRRSAARRWR